MLFSSMVFLWIFLPVVFCGYHLIRDNYKNAWLLTASLIFYSWGEPAYLFLMLFYIIANYCFGMLMSQREKKKPILITAVIFDLTVLGYFKYFYTAAAACNGFLGKEMITVKNIALPLGISFYTFQIMSYVIDLYRGEIKVQKNIFRLALYISFFPQLVAGPIIKYKEIENQIADRKSSLEKTAYGMKRFIYGLGKKVILSNSIAEVVDAVFCYPAEGLGTLWVWIGTGLYTLQIYYDFSGYSDMAVGLGKMFGFDFMENFNYPYLSGTVQEFWRRWHISLSAWFREYIYIPLGGSRKGRIRTCLNLWIVFAVTGIWHGATFNFWIWGLWHGFFIFIERLGLGRLLGRRCFKVFGHLYTLFVVAAGWGIFRCGSWMEACKVWKVMFDFGSLTGGSSGHLAWYSVASVRSLAVIVAAVFLAGPFQKLFPKLACQFKDEEKFYGLELGIQVLIFAVSIMLLVSGQYNPFIYFKF